MSMLDWNEYHKQVLAGVAGIGHAGRDDVRGCQGLGGAAAKTTGGQAG